MSYLNTKPLLYGIERSRLVPEGSLILDYPSRLAAMLKNQELDLALLPVAAIPTIPNARIVSNYGIAADGNVVSVAIFSHVPMEEIESVYLDYQSRTSVRLAQLLLEQYWKKQVTYIPADPNFIEKTEGTTAAVIIGDRALSQLHNFRYVYDLSEAWNQLTGLDFVFAAWVANKELPEEFVGAFDAANAEGLNSLDEIIRSTPFPDYSLDTYYRKNIKYQLDERKLKGLLMFLKMIGHDADGLLHTTEQ